MNKAIGEEAYLVNNAVAWFIAVVFAYVTNKLWVFESKSWKLKTVIKKFPNSSLQEFSVCLLRRAVFGFLLKK